MQFTQPSVADESMTQPLSAEEMNAIAGGDWDMAVKALKRGLVNGVEGAIVGTVLEPGAGTLVGFGVGLIGGMVGSLYEDIQAGAHL